MPKATRTLSCAHCTTITGRSLARPRAEGPGRVAAADPTRLVLIPSYNSGAKVLETVAEARRVWAPVWVVVDGSTDGTDHQLQQLAATDPSLRTLVLPGNQGKGAAV